MTGRITGFLSHGYKHSSVLYLQSFAVSFRRHDPVIFSFFPPQAPAKPELHNLKEPKHETLKKQTKKPPRNLGHCAFWYIFCLTFTIHSQDTQSCTSEEKGEPADLLCFSKARSLSLKFVVSCERRGRF